MTDIAQWSSRDTGMVILDRAIRWPLYLLSGCEPLLVLFLLLSQPQAPTLALGILVAVAVAHTVACVAFLRAGLIHFLGGPRPRGWLIGVAVALTVTGLAAVAATFQAGRATDGVFQLGIPAGASLLLCAALTCAAAPMLTAGRIFGVVALPAAAAAVLATLVQAPDAQVWALYYLVVVGPAAISYRFTVWLLGAMWQMHRGREAQARLAVAEERLRVARDLHDVLGRNLALIALNSELAAQLVRRGRDGAAERMLEVRSMAQDSMREVREVVAGHRTTELDSELSGARSVLRSAGIKARVIGDGTVLPCATQAALGWVVREATTNILRHSDPTAVKIDLDVSTDSDTGPVAQLRIENDGAPDSASSAGTGTGLIGLRQRLAALGGDLAAEPRPGGRFLVQARLPLEPTSPPTAGRAEPPP